MFLIQYLEDPAKTTVAAYGPRSMTTKDPSSIPTYAFGFDVGSATFRFSSQNGRALLDLLARVTDALRAELDKEKVRA